MEKIRIKLNTYDRYGGTSSTVMIITKEQKKLLDYLLDNGFFDGDYEVLADNGIVDLT